MGYTWFQVHHKLFTTPKFRSFSFEERYRFIMLLWLASDSNERGVILLDWDDVAATLEMGLDALHALLTRFAAKWAVELPDDGTIVIRNWNEYQYDKPSDAPENARDRQRKRRLRLKSEQEEPIETTLETDVTPMSRDVTPLSRDVTPKAEQSKAYKSKAEQLRTRSCEEGIANAPPPPLLQIEPDEIPPKPLEAVQYRELRGTWQRFQIVIACRRVREIQNVRHPLMLIQKILRDDGAMMEHPKPPPRPAALSPPPERVQTEADVEARKKLFDALRAKGLLSSADIGEEHGDD